MSNHDAPPSPERWAELCAKIRWLNSLVSNYLVPPECVADCELPDCPYVHNWTTVDRNELNAAQAEIERLRELFRLDGEQHAAHIKLINEQNDARLRAYAAEIARLRAAPPAKLVEAIRFAHEWIGGLPVTPSFEDKRAAQAALEQALAEHDAAPPDDERYRAGFDVGFGSLKEGDQCILVAEGNMPSGPAKLLTVFHDGDAQIELRKVLTVKWRYLRPLSSPPEPPPVPMILFCPSCGVQHIDGPDYGPHRSHLCRSCGHIWRPADIPTVGVAAIQTSGKVDHPPILGRAHRV